MTHLGKFNGVLLVSDFDDTLYGEDMRVSEEKTGRARPILPGRGDLYCSHRAAPPHLRAPRRQHTHQRAGGSLQRLRLYDFARGRMIYETFLPDRGREDLQEMARAIPPSALRPTTRTTSTSTSPTRSP